MDSKHDSEVMLDLGGLIGAFQKLTHTTDMIITTQGYTVKQRDPLNWTVSTVGKTGKPKVLAYHPTLTHALQWLYDRLLMHSEPTDGPVESIEEFIEATQDVLSGLLEAIGNATQQQQKVSQ